MELDEDSETSTRGLQNRCSAAELIQLIEYSHFLALAFSIKHGLHALAISPHPTNPASSVMFDCFAEIWFSVTLLWRTKTLVSPHAPLSYFHGRLTLFSFINCGSADLA